MNKFFTEFGSNDKALWLGNNQIWQNTSEKSIAIDYLNSISGYSGRIYSKPSPNRSIPWIYLICKLSQILHPTHEFPARIAVLFYFLLQKIIYLFTYWRIIALQNFVVFCQTSTWISHICHIYIRVCIYPLPFEPPSHLSPHSTTLGWYRVHVWVC